MNHDMEWIFTIMQSYGLQGVVMVVLGYAVYYLMNSATAINNDRLGERDVLIHALDRNSNAVQDNVAATLERNLVTKELAGATEKQAMVLEMFIEKHQLLYDTLKEKILDQKIVIDSLAEANRVSAHMLRDLVATSKEANNMMQTHIDSLKRNTECLREIEDKIRFLNRNN